MVVCDWVNEIAGIFSLDYPILYLKIFKIIGQICVIYILRISYILETKTQSKNLGAVSSPFVFGLYRFRN